MSARKKVLVLGSTGSIGTQALDVARKNPERLEVVGLAAGTRAKELLAQAQEDGDAGAVHEGDSGTVYHHLPGQDLVQLLVQVLEQALDPVVVDVPGEGDGEYSVVGGVGDGHR